jgi:hypothetical protein
MVQLLTTKYNKEQERLLMASNALGVCTSAVIGVLIGYMTGLFSNLKPGAYSSTVWTIWSLGMGLIISPLSWVVTLGVCVLLLKKKDIGRWKHEIGRMIPGTLFLPLGVAYAFVVMGLVILPLCSLLLSYINSVLAMEVGLLAFLPFMLFGATIVLPESPGGKALRKSIHRLKESKNK